MIDSKTNSRFVFMAITVAIIMACAITTTTVVTTVIAGRRRRRSSGEKGTTPGSTVRSSSIRMMRGPRIDSSSPSPSSTVTSSFLWIGQHLASQEHRQHDQQLQLESFASSAEAKPPLMYQHGQALLNETKLDYRNNTTYYDDDHNGNNDSNDDDGTGTIFPGTATQLQTTATSTTSTSTTRNNKNRPSMAPSCCWAVNVKTALTTYPTNADASTGDHGEQASSSTNMFFNAHETNHSFSDSSSLPPNYNDTTKNQQQEQHQDITSSTETPATTSDSSSSSLPSSAHQQDGADDGTDNHSSVSNSAAPDATMARSSQQRQQEQRLLLVMVVLCAIFTIFTAILAVLYCCHCSSPPSNHHDHRSSCCCDVADCACHACPIRGRQRHGSILQRTRHQHHYKMFGATTPSTTIFTNSSNKDDRHLLSLSSNVSATEFSSPPVIELWPNDDKQDRFTSIDRGCTTTSTVDRHRPPRNKSYVMSRNPINTQRATVTSRTTATITTTMTTTTAAGTGTGSDPFVPSHGAKREPNTWKIFRNCVDNSSNSNIDYNHYQHDADCYNAETDHEERNPCGIEVVEHGGTFDDHTPAPAPPLPQPRLLSLSASSRTTLLDVALVQHPSATTSSRPPPLPYIDLKWRAGGDGPRRACCVDGEYDDNIDVDDAASQLSDLSHVDPQDCLPHPSWTVPVCHSQRLPDHGPNDPHQEQQQQQQHRHRQRGGAADYHSHATIMSNALFDLPAALLPPSVASSGWQHDDHDKNDPCPHSHSSLSLLSFSSSSSPQDANVVPSNQNRSDSFCLARLEL